MSAVWRVVFDTNIWFSALGWKGNPHRCVEAAREKRCLSVTCEAILDELAEKLELKRGFSAAQTEGFTSEIRTFSQTVTISGELKLVAADPDDDAILECAIVAQANYLVSGDRHLLFLKKHQNIEIVTASDFLKLLTDAGSIH